MAKIIYGAGIAEIRGASGGTQFSRNQYGGYMRPRTNPIQPNTTSQMDIRQKFRSVATAWSTLTPTQHDAWNSAEYILRDPLGQPKPMSGFALFMLLNRNLLTIGSSMIFDPPPDFSLEYNFSSVIIDCSQDEPGPPARKMILVSFLPIPMSAGMSMIVKATAKTTLGRTTLKGRERIIYVGHGEAANPTNITTEYEAKFGQMSSEDIDHAKIYFRVQIVSEAKGVASVGNNGMCVYGSTVQLF